MSTENRPYTHSGSLGMGAVVIPLVGLSSGLVLAMLYAYITVYIPIAGYLSVLFVLGLGLGVGRAVSWAIKISHCRSPIFAGVMALGIGLFTLYAAWVSFEFVLLRQAELDIPFSALLDMFMNPGAVWDLASSIAVDGWYSVFGLTPSGAFIWILWAIEALIIVGMISVAGLGALDGDVYCEGCGAWTEEGRPLRLAVVESEDHMERALAGDIDVLAQLHRAPASEYPHLSVSTKSCPRCANTNAFRVAVASVDNEGDTSEAVVTSHLLVSADEHARLVSSKRRPSASDAP